MSKKRTFLILSILVGVACVSYFLFPIYMTVKVPNDFLASGDVFLGQSLNELKESRHITIGEYDVTEDQINPYFDGIGFQFDHYFFKSDRLKSVILVDENTDENMPVEQKVSSLFKFCKQKYGSNFKILEVENGGKSLLPRITWQFEGYAVILSYMPYEKYLTLKKSQKFVPLNIALQITYDSQENYKESKEFTLQSLHLD